MELRDYIKIISKNLLLIIVVAAIVGLLSYYLASKKAPVYYGYRTVAIDRAETAPTGGVYQYDGYYSAQSSALEGKNLSAWLNTVPTLTAIYERAGQPAPQITDKKLKDFISTKSEADSSIISISMADEDESNLKNRLTATKGLIDDYFNSRPNNKNYLLKIGDISITNQKNNPSASTASGLISGVILGVVLTFAKEYFKQA